MEEVCTRVPSPRRAALWMATLGCEDEIQTDPPAGAGLAMTALPRRGQGWGCAAPPKSWAWAGNSPCSVLAGQTDGVQP